MWIAVCCPGCDILRVLTHVREERIATVSNSHLNASSLRRCEEGIRLYYEAQLVKLLKEVIAVYCQNYNKPNKYIRWAICSY